MEVIIGLMALFGFVKWLSEENQLSQAERDATDAKNKSDAAIDEIAHTTADRMKHELDAAQLDLKNQAITVSGQQSQSFTNLGQAGGEGTVGRQILANTAVIAARDNSLLLTRYWDAMKDLTAQVDLAKTNLDNDYTAVMSKIESDMQTSFVNMLGDLAGLAIKMPNVGGGGSGSSDPFGLYTGNPNYGGSGQEANYKLYPTTGYWPN